MTKAQFIAAFVAANWNLQKNQSELKWTQEAIAAWKMFQQIEKHA